MFSIPKKDFVDYILLSYPMILHCSHLSLFTHDDARMALIAVGGIISFYSIHVPTDSQKGNPKGNSEKSLIQESLVLFLLPVFSRLSHVPL